VVGIQPEPALCLACARNGIPVFDYQHGVINSQHPSYNENWVQSKHKDELPTGIFCWDEPTAKYLREWCSRAGIKVFTAGQPWVDRFLKQKAPIDKDMPFIQSCVDAPTLRNEKRKVLVTLQWGLDRFYEIGRASCRERV